ncbi:MAG: hypothetical protein CMJ59_05540 [Planctomycetaceae bacterium]|nr:hypothetical protein [Planctomycetaceae bacterium]
MRAIRGLTLVGLLLAAAVVAAEQTEVQRYGFPPPRRKLIVYGWELGFLEARQLRQMAPVMQRQPFDGIVFSLFHEGQPRDQAFIHSVRLEDAQLAAPAEQLAKIDWTTFTDNFLVIKAGENFPHQGVGEPMDWFDDAHWDAICHNVGVLARVAVAAHCVGLAFDPEPYHASVWNYDLVGNRKPPPRRTTKSFAEFAAVVRRRGAQYMRAIQTEIPNVRLFNLYQAVRLPPSRLAETIYALYPAFINGMLDAAAPQVTFIDGNEYGFSLLTRSDYTNAYVNVRQRKLTLIDPSNRATYRRQVQVSAPIYLDDIFGSHANRRWVGTYLSGAEKRRFFEHRLFHAMDAVDEYVWVYGERPSWFGSPRVPRWAVESVHRVRRQVGQLRLQKREEDADLIDRLRAVGELRDRELAALKPAGRGTPRLERPRATIPHLPAGTQPPTLDGILEDPAWKGAARLAEFKPLLYLIRDRRLVDTRCLVTWDDEFLYLGFDCSEPRIGELDGYGPSERRRNRTTLVLSEDHTVDALVRVDLPFEGHAEVLVKGSEAAWKKTPKRGRAVDRFHRRTPRGWVAEWRVAWQELGGSPQGSLLRRATVTRVRAPWVEHDSWAPQIDPNLIDEELLGEWLFRR